MKRMRTILAFVVALLQVAAASAHELHHALEATDVEHFSCADSLAAEDSGCDHVVATEDDNHSHSPAQHDCDTCADCDESDGDVGQLPQTQRVMDGVSSLACLLVVHSPAANPDAGWSALPSQPLTLPAALHAVVLPLLA